MLYSGTDPESYITEYTSVYEDHLYRISMLKTMVSMQTFREAGTQGEEHFFLFLITLKPRVE